jgi:DNA-binding MarR family transcriptional regulator
MSAQLVREQYFGRELASDPGWDILLALYVSVVEKRQECVKNVCLASRAPATTVIRWVTMLEKHGLVAREVAATDKRRVLLSLTSLGLQRMEQALDACAESDAQHGVGRLRLAAT